MKQQHPFRQFHFCPRCGSAHFFINNEKSKRCEDCGFVYYFNPSAACVAVIVNERGELLVCRRAKEPAKGTWDLPGGFSDCFETSEESVIREVKEETGLDVQQTTYLFSLPNTYVYSGFTVHTMDLFFLCRVNETGKAHAMDDAEELQWISLSDIQPEAFGLDSIREGVRRILKKNPTSPPVREEKVGFGKQHKKNHI
jgi:mutator protein MutT